MRIDLEVLSSVDHIITASTRIETQRVTVRETEIELETETKISIRRHLPAWAKALSVQEVRLKKICRIRGVSEQRNHRDHKVSF